MVGNRDYKKLIGPEMQKIAARVSNNDDLFAFSLRNANLLVQRHKLDRLDERERREDSGSTNRTFRLQRNVDKNECHISQVIYFKLEIKLFEKLSVQINTLNFA